MPVRKTYYSHTHMQNERREVDSPEKRRTLSSTPYIPDGRENPPNILERYDLKVFNRCVK